MDTLEYDDDAVLAEYLTRNFQQFMSPIECRALNLALKRSKAEHNNVAADRLPKWLSQETAEVRQLSLNGYAAIQTSIKDRMMRDLVDGSLFINRCPQCQKIVKTPLAQQCLWCGHDWHANT